MKFTHMSTRSVDSLEVVEKIPAGFHIWNIGCIEGSYIAIAEDAEDGVRVNLDTLKAINVGKEDAKKLVRATSCGINTLEKAKKAIVCKRKGPSTERKRAIALEVLEILERIS